MISIVISSYQPTFFAALEKNIAETIGVPYEIVQIYNPGTMGICEAYNKGGKLARHPYLLFLHEDVLFHTENWGKKLVVHLEIPNCGVVGIAGSNYVPRAPSGWYMLNKEYNYINIIQNNKSGGNKKEIKTFDEIRVPAFGIDGVFMAVKRMIWAEIKFCNYLTGFHSYDLDFSLAVGAKYDNYIISDIAVEHFSEGVDGKDWFKSIIKVRSALGIKAHGKIDKELEYYMFRLFLQKYVQFFQIDFSFLKVTLPFLSKNLTLSNYFSIMKIYLRYFFYAQELNKMNKK